MIRNSIFWLILLFLTASFPLFGQHSIDAGLGVVLNIDVNGVHGSAASSNGYKIIYATKHSYVSTSVDVDADWSGFIPPCSED